MNDLLSTINNLTHSDIHTTIHQRIQQFKTIDTHSAEELFQELCFCILTANCNAERTIHIHAQLSKSFSIDPIETLAKKLKEHGYRFPNRAAYIVEAAKKKDMLSPIIHTRPPEERRTWLVDNITGLGYKEASHFLRNIGYDDYAIIDSHILDLLERYHRIKRPNTLTAKKYREIEEDLRALATKTQLTLAELDLYLWYLETGKILK